MDLKLSGKIAVVTAASKGIGLAVTHALRDEGARVVAGARNTQNLEGLSGVARMDVDLSTAEGPARLVQHAIAEHGRLDVLVNNMGAVRLRLDGFLATSDDEFQWAMNMNFFSALRATRAAVTQMVKPGWRNDCQRCFCQRLLPTRRRDDRLWSS
jgi:NAD(P)-dependent dehydrogenase (short-subunit alcohol dehydrogenase family)